VEAKYRLDPLPGLEPYLPIILGERFGALPWEIAEAPLLPYLRVVRMLGLEGEIQAHVEKLPTDQQIIWEG
jgi:hypothetical protein